MSDTTEVRRAIAMLDGASLDGGRLPDHTALVALADQCDAAFAHDEDDASALLTGLAVSMLRNALDRPRADRLEWTRSAFEVLRRAASVP